MTFALADVTEIPMVAVEDAIDPATVAALERRIDAALALGHGHVVVDLTAATIPGGRTEGLLCGALRGLAHRGARMAFASTSAPVRDALERCEADGIELHPTANAALASAHQA